MSTADERPSPKEKSHYKEVTFINEEGHPKSMTRPKMLLKMREAWHMSPARNIILRLIRKVRERMAHISAHVAVLGCYERNGKRVFNKPHQKQSLG